MSNATYNGFKNWTQWNVSLWINNDEGLYRMAVDACTRFKVRGAAVRALKRELAAMGLDRTPDGAKYSEAALRAACVGIV